MASPYKKSSRSSLVDMSSRITSPNGGPYVTSNNYTATATGVKYSRGNRGYRNLARATGDVGGSFFVHKSEFGIGPRGHATAKVGIFDYEYNGYILPYTLSAIRTVPAFTFAFNDDTVWNNGLGDNTLKGLGAKAVARSLPTNSNASVAVTVGELRKDGLPHIVGKDILKSRARDYKAMGSEYLNIEFGWKPFVSDLKKFAKSVTKSSEILERYYSESGKDVNRSYSFGAPATVFYHDSTVNNYLSPSNSDTQVASSNVFGTPRGTLHRVERYEQSVWFNGCFRYHAIPRSSGFYDRIARYAKEADILYGVELTPSTLWDLSPWTWAADWFADCGDVIHNLSAFAQDGLTMKYGYLMRQLMREHTYELTGFNACGITSTNAYSRNIVRQRVKANPFGFGLTDGDLTDRQWAILAAIGISRS